MVPWRNRPRSVARSTSQFGIAISGKYSISSPQFNSNNLTSHDRKSAKKIFHWEQTHSHHPPLPNTPVIRERHYHSVVAARIPCGASSGSGSRTGGRSAPYGRVWRRNQRKKGVAKIKRGNFASRSGSHGAIKLAGGVLHEPDPVRVICAARYGPTASGPGLAEGIGKIQDTGRPFMHLAVAVDEGEFA